jgi:hypothetical protein
LRLLIVLWTLLLKLFHSVKASDWSMNPIRSWTNLSSVQFGPMSATLIDLPDGRTDRRTDKQTDTVAYRDARMHLKRWVLDEVFIKIW